MAGGSVIGQYASAAAAEEAKSTLERTAADVPNWPELHVAHEAQSNLEDHKKTLRGELTEISRSHRIAGHCRLCSRG
jgi:hypothetical protein